MSAPFAPRDEQVPSRLAHNAVGLSGVLFQSITHMAPGIAVAFSIIFTTTYAGGSTPLSVLLALVGCLAVASCIGQLAKYLPSAGGLYTYSSNGLGPQVGFLVAWAYMLAEPIVPAFVFLVFGNLINSTTTTYWHWPGWIWAPAVVLIGVIVWYLVFEGIKISTEAGVILGIFEIVVFVALALTLIVDAGGRNTLSVFGAHNFNQHGMGSVIPGMIYAVLAFIGFEASAPLGEEAQNPRRTIPLAVIFSCLIIGIFYVLCYYAATVYFGPAKMLSGFLVYNNGDPWTGMAKTVWDWGWIIVFIALVNSSIANANAGANAATRAAYAMARIGLLPGRLSAIDPRRRTPLRRHPRPGGRRGHPGPDPGLAGQRAPQRRGSAGHYRRSAGHPHLPADRDQLLHLLLDVPAAGVQLVPAPRRAHHRHRLLRPDRGGLLRDRLRRAGDRKAVLALLLRSVGGTGLGPAWSRLARVLHAVPSQPPARDGRCVHGRDRRR